MNAFALLLVAIAFEIVGTTSLKASHGFSKPLPSALVVICYGATFLIFARAVKTLPLSTSYAIWSGLGTAGAVVAGWMLFDEALSTPRLVGIVLILIGVVVLNLFGGAAH